LERFDSAAGDCALQGALGAMPPDGSELDEKIASNVADPADEQKPRRRDGRYKTCVFRSKIRCFACAGNFAPSERTRREQNIGKRRDGRRRYGYPLPAITLAAAIGFNVLALAIQFERAGAAVQRRQRPVEETANTRATSKASARDGKRRGRCVRDAREILSSVSRKPPIAIDDMREG